MKRSFTQSNVPVSLPWAKLYVAGDSKSSGSAGKTRVVETGGVQVVRVNAWPFSIQP